LALLASPGPAFGNGRFPAAGQIAADPGDPAHLVVRATYGMLRGQGEDWRWICETSVGYEDNEDPFFAVLQGGSLIAATFRGLSVSPDGGCSWTRVPGDAGALPALDLVRDAQNPARAVALTTVQLDDDERQRLMATDDSGKSWQPLGIALPQGFFGSTLEMAPGLPTRLYVVGAQGVTVSLARSDDAGKSWQVAPIALNGGQAAYLSAVDPLNPDRLWLRVQHEDGDRLLVSGNGGTSWQQVFQASGALLGFALSPDGSQVALAVPKAGVWRAMTADHLFAKVNPVGARCLTWTPAGLFACGDEATQGFTIARSTDGGATFVPKLLQASLQPATCPADTRTAKVCPNYWPAVAIQLGILKPTPVPPPAKPAPADEGCGAARAAKASGVAGWVGLMLTAWWLRRR